MLGGGETVTVLTLVLTDVLIDVLTLGSVVVVGGSVVVSVFGGVVVSVTVSVGATAGADVDVVVVVVVVVLVVVSVLSEESDSRLTDSHTMAAINRATSAPNPISAAGLRYQGTGSSGGTPGWS